MSEIITVDKVAYKAPYADIIRKLTESEYNDLKQDVASRGIIVPVVIDEYGGIIDGYHRAKIASELALDFKTEIRPGLSDEEKEAMAIDLNWHRRHLSKEELGALIERRKAQGWSNPRIADEVGVDTTTILRSTCADTQVDRVNGKDGKSRPATKPTAEEIAERRVKVRELKAQGWSNARIAKELGVSKGTIASDLKAVKQPSILNKDQKETSRVQGLFENTAPPVPDKVIDAKRAGRLAREAAAEERRRQVESEPKPELPPGVDIRLGEFQTVLSDIESNSIDLVFTDPPYHEKYLYLWPELAKVAARVLKPGGLLISYSGQYHLPAVMDSLSEYLEYVWLGTLKMRGPGKNTVQQRKIYNRAKPLLFYSKGDYDPQEFIDDFFNDDKPEKDSHEWQQGIAPALYYIDKLTKSGDTVLDPFLGSGTTAEATVRLGRNIIGAEKDAAHYQTVINRIREVIGE